ncbi:MAG: hypothetical protein N3D71_13885, partial [Burkholderiaceae bacterium]|nr:hypothetical protein [Burkholderiaceae bacterium]
DVYKRQVRTPITFSDREVFLTACVGIAVYDGSDKRKEDLLKALTDFKSGAKPATVMHQLAKGYTDSQLEAIATWFAAQKPAK